MQAQNVAQARKSADSHVIYDLLRFGRKLGLADAVIPREDNNVDVEYMLRQMITTTSQIRAWNSVLIGRPDCGSTGEC
jgi:hypothetical protein